jgi:mannose-6-phosphate isomerase
VYFVGATAELIMESEDSASPFVTFKAFCELQGKEGAEQKL